ncbi:uncharacterized protein LOC113330463 [Papaver somniferum]|uniref:uncharacterized protein LOC113330463 n=1 Tax=Papaver somniferum TaxID=3469 RepID=UPI000E7049A0|nr:uncharacterized protein LOC113330463 [Papaver somniferum]
MGDSSISNITFSEEDQMAEEGHNRGLYVTALINDFDFKRALIDTDIASNVVPLKTLKAAKFQQCKIVLQPIVMTDFEGNKTSSYGYTYLDLKVGLVYSTVKFHVIEKQPDYHMILRRTWLHDNKVVPSTYHQHMKSQLNDKVVRI